MMHSARFGAAADDGACAGAGAAAAAAGGLDVAPDRDAVAQLRRSSSDITGLITQSGRGFGAAGAAAGALAAAGDDADGLLSRALDEALDLEIGRAHV